ncbi:hypothetical protein D3C84_1181210 [compost metagenome]
MSEPKRRMASSKVMMGKSPRSTFRMCSQSLRIISSMISRTWGAVMKEVSTSIWVNSGWRSARRSSSRKHLTIW